MNEIAQRPKKPRGVFSNFTVTKLENQFYSVIVIHLFTSHDTVKYCLNNFSNNQGISSVLNSIILLKNRHHNVKNRKFEMSSKKTLERDSFFF